MANKLHETSKFGIIVVKNPSDGTVDDKMRLTKEETQANLYLLKVYLLVLKLIVIKEFSSLMTKIFRLFTIH